jgi:hypothetical protein
MGPILWLFLALGTIGIACGLPICSRWPTAAETVLARRYPRRRAMPALDNPLQQWSGPADVWAEDRSISCRQFALMGVRTSALAGALLWGICWWFQPVVSRLPAVPLHRVLWGMALAPAALFLAQAGLIAARREPPTRRLVLAGVVVPDPKRPLLEWDRIATYEVVPHHILAHRRSLALHQRDGLTRYVPLPANEQATAVISAVAKRVREGAAPPAAQPPTITNWTIGLVLSTAFAIIGGMLLAAHPMPLRDQPLIVLAVSLLAAPGTWVASCLWHRRALESLVGMAVALNLFATFSLLIATFAFAAIHLAR